MSSLTFLPNSPTLMNAGRPKGQLSACFVLPVEDTMEGIFDAVKNMALVQATGGGTGFSFSRLRPKGDLVASTSGEAAGPVAFMGIFDCVTENIKQGGRRRGANMGVLRVDHPDIIEFITSKKVEPALRNFNISVAVTDAFMQAVQEDGYQDFFHPRTGRKTGQARARDLFETIVHSAWQTGDPGLLFLDPINRTNPTPDIGPLEATNPCGEIPLLPYESCNLGSINLARMVRGSKGDATVDIEALRLTTRQAVRFLDDVVEVSTYPIEDITRMTRGNRKIGLGVMGFAEMLIHLGISYDSDGAIETADRIMGVIAEEALAASQDLARERGVFPNWTKSIYKRKGLAVRNATRTAIAPTGTIGIIAGTSPGIEPLFALAYQRSHVLDGQRLYEVNPPFRASLREYGLDEDRMLESVFVKGRLAEVGGLPEAVRRLFVTALEIPSRRHLEVQAAFQRHVDNSVSKTVNLPQEATVDDVRDVYQRAWSLGLKGVTIYRYRSKAAQVFELGVAEESYQLDHGSSCDPGECNV
jgi:ribonucleoside-diphosphate reductase alpha chain